MKRLRKNRTLLISVRRFSAGITVLYRGRTRTSCWRSAARGATSSGRVSARPGSTPSQSGAYYPNTVPLLDLAFGLRNEFFGKKNAFQSGIHPPPEQNDWQTPVKILPYRNFVAEGKNDKIAKYRLDDLFPSPEGPDRTLLVASSVKTSFCLQRTNLLA